MTRPQPSAAWLQRLRTRADEPPAKPRAGLWWDAVAIGSLETDLLEDLLLDLPPTLMQRRDGATGPGWQLRGDLTSSIGRLAAAIRQAGLAPSWRNEQLAVRGARGETLGTVERGVTRILGIATHAVHLAGFLPDGRHWVQQRAFDKPNDPGMWDTMVGGMVPAGEAPERTLERETWEEAGLKLSELQRLRHGGRLTLRRPGGARGGYIIQEVDWYTATVPEGVVPVNQDGEVVQFRRMDAAEICTRLEQEEFTVDAALVLSREGI
ncbi:NUDIX domain-containing protein [Ramlibacter sp.]|uniref:NUDIX hydrolase n=1 Tax=Ramlibacter sp. TaxID=1917967 RepID=UPI0017CB2796|nr:NUDIX domain-containing protein [Ramlibacter sp.]MBA2674179.1 NUDIX domain-containing protein [Ramlibacter sp.]